MRIRSTKPEFWRSRTIASVDWDARLVLKGVESYVDDNGVGKDSVVLLAADVFPHDLAEDPDTLARVSRALARLSEANLLVRYELDGERLVYVRRWKSIQRVDKPNKGRYPRPDGTTEYEQDVDESIGAGQKPARPARKRAPRAASANLREDVANPPETLAPGTGEQGNRGTGEQPLSSGEPDTMDPFIEFWDNYPRKTQKRDAEKAYRRALKRASAETILAGLKRYGFKPDPTFQPQAERWLNGDRWTDETPASNVHSLRPASGAQQQTFADGTPMPWDR